jgi:uncharacterized protein with NAD-binding domain and iron-sulfur cluster
MATGGTEVQSVAIVGANIAGASTAEALRRLGYDGHITRNIWRASPMKSD